MNKIFYLLFFSLYAILGAEKYNCTFKQILHDPLDIQRNALDFSQCSCDEETRLFVENASKSFERQSINFKKDNYCFDVKFKTAVCLQGNGSGIFQVAFYDHQSNRVFTPHKHCIQKPSCLAVSDRFIFHLSTQATFCFIKVPQEYDNMLNQKLIQMNFVNFDSSLLDPKKKIYCFPGDSGQFYLTHDHEGRNNLFLFKIEEKNIEFPVNKETSILNKIQQNNPEESRKSRLNFWSLRFFGLGFFFLATIFLYRKYYSN